MQGQHVEVRDLLHRDLFFSWAQGSLPFPQVALSSCPPQCSMLWFARMPGQVGVRALSVSELRKTN